MLLFNCEVMSLLLHLVYKYLNIEDIQFKYLTMINFNSSEENSNFRFFYHSTNHTSKNLNLKQIPYIQLELNSNGYFTYKNETFRDKPIIDELFLSSSLFNFLKQIVLDSNILSHNQIDSYDSLYENKNEIINFDKIEISNNGITKTFSYGKTNNLNLKNDTEKILYDLKKEMTKQFFLIKSFSK